MKPYHMDNAMLSLGLKFSIDKKEDKKVATTLSLKVFSLSDFIIYMGFGLFEFEGFFHRRKKRLKYI